MHALLISLKECKNPSKMDMLYNTIYLLFKTQALCFSITPSNIKMLKDYQVER